jgi:hypothetical protein
MNHFKEFILAIQTFNLEILTADHEESSTPAKQGIQQYSISRENGYKTNVQEAREDFYQILKDYFAATDLDHLKSLIINSEEPEQVLTYNGNGNQLADAFKQLYEANLIVGCTKAQLEKWISRHFSYISNNQLKHFTAGYLNGIISSDIKKCQSPILDIHRQQDRFVIKPTLRNKKNQQFG